MDAFLNQVFAGLATGGIYASVALALVMIYQATHLVNFAQGELAMFSTYIAYALIEAGLPYWIAFVITLVFSFVTGIAIERLLMRRIQHKSQLTAVIVFIGLLVAVNGLAADSALCPGLRSLPGAKGVTLVAWSEVEAAWRSGYGALAEDFRAGRAAVAPRDAAACRLCDLQPLCRIQQLVDTDPSSEGESAYDA